MNFSHLPTWTMRVLMRSDLPTAKLWKLNNAVQTKPNQWTSFVVHVKKPVNQTNKTGCETETGAQNHAPFFTVFVLLNLRFFPTWWNTFSARNEEVLLFISTAQNNLWNFGWSLRDKVYGVSLFKTYRGPLLKRRMDVSLLLHMLIECLEKTVWKLMP